MQEFTSRGQNFTTQSDGTREPASGRAAVADWPKAAEYLLSGSHQHKTPHSFPNHQMVRTTPDCCIGSSFVTRGADSRIAVSAINRSAGSPGKSAGNSAAMAATAGVMVNNSTRGSVNASCNQWSGDRSRPIRPLATSVPTSRAGIPASERKAHAADPRE